MNEAPKARSFQDSEEVGEKGTQTGHLQWQYRGLKRCNSFQKNYSSQQGYKDYTVLTRFDSVTETETNLPAKDY